MERELRSLDRQLDSGYLTDLKKIETLSLRNSESNARFTQVLKSKDPAQMDELVKTVSARVASKVDCTQCANCCRSLIIAPDYPDISRLACATNMTTQDFKRKYMRRDFEGDMVMKQKPCPFLKNNRCSVYENRPKLCRRYPYLDESGFVENLNRVLRNLSVCPIAYNTFESLKASVR